MPEVAAQIKERTLAADHSMTAVNNARKRYQESKFQLVYNYKACHDIIVERVVSHCLNMVVALTPAWEEIEPQLRTMA